MEETITIDVGAFLAAIWPYVMVWLFGALPSYLIFRWSPVGRNDHEDVQIATIFWPIAVWFVPLFELSRWLMDQWQEGGFFNRFIIWSDGAIGRLTERTVHEDEFGRLVEQRRPPHIDGGSARFVIVTDHDGQQYRIAVPPSMVRAKEAVAWTYRMTTLEYNPTIRV